MQEARLLKKLRAKKITEAEFEARMASLQSGANIPSEGCDLPIMIIIAQSDGVNLTIYSSTLARMHVTAIAPPPRTHHPSLSFLSCVRMFSILLLSHFRSVVSTGASSGCCASSTAGRREGGRRPQKITTPAPDHQEATDSSGSACSQQARLELFVF